MKVNKPNYWIRRTHLLRPDEYICSVCKRSFRKAQPVCPACGSKMGGKKYDPTWVDEAEELSALLDDD